MTVMEHIQLRIGTANQLRWLALCLLAALLTWSYPGEHITSPLRFWIFGAVLLYLWLLVELCGHLLQWPMTSAACPRCRARFVLSRGMTQCPQCGVSFEAHLKRKRSHVAAVRAPSLIISRSLRIGR